MLSLSEVKVVTHVGNPVLPVRLCSHILSIGLLDFLNFSTVVKSTSQSALQIMIVCPSSKVGDIFPSSNVTQRSRGLELDAAVY